MPRRVTIDWQDDGDPVAGAVTANGAPPRSFNGWLELLSLLRASVEPAAGPPATNDPREVP